MQFGESELTKLDIFPSPTGTNQLFGSFDSPDGTTQKSTDPDQLPEVRDAQATSRCTDTLTFPPSPRPRVSRVRVRVQEVEGEQTQERFFQPHFLQAPGDMLAHEGKLCRLDCKVGRRRQR